MRVLLDECVPRPLRRELAGHDVQTVQELGWAGKRNGELIALIRTVDHDAFVTRPETRVPAKYRRSTDPANCSSFST